MLPEGICMMNFKIHKDLRKKFKVLCAELQLDMSQILTATVAEALAEGKTAYGREKLRQQFQDKKLYEKHLRRKTQVRHAVGETVFETEDH